MSYANRKKNRQKKKKALGVLLLIAAVVIAGGLMFAYLSMKARTIELDALTLCPKVGPHGYFAVVVDATDSFLPAQAKYIEKYFDELRGSIPTYSQVSVYVTSDFARGEISPRLVICNPGDGSGVSSLTGNPEKLKKRWQQAFGGPVTQAIEESISAPPGEQSPILEIIQSVTLSAFPLEAGQGVRQSLVVVSDMLEHSSLMSHYQSPPDFDRLRNSGSIAHLKPNLSGVEVTIIYVSRPGFERSQTRSHAAFWEAYFRHYGAAIKMIERI